MASKDKVEIRHQRVEEKYKNVAIAAIAEYRLYKNDETNHVLQKMNAISDYEAGLEEDMSVAVPPSIRLAISGVHRDVKGRAIGMALNQPECWEGLNVVDLGCGCGRDAFFMSRLVGPSGSVLGVDLSADRIQYCKDQIPYHMSRYKYAIPNVDFMKSYVEDIKGCGVNDNSMDLVTTNAVIVLCPIHRTVYQAAFDILKPGGEMFFSEIFADQTLPEKFDTDMRLLSHGLDGQQWETFLQTAQEVGFTHPRLYRVSKIVFNDKMKKDVEPYNFVIATYRMFKLPPGDHSKPVQVVYKGGVEDHKKTWHFDHSTTFKVDEPLVVDGELGAILRYTRFNPFFDFKTPKDGDEVAVRHPKYSPFQLKRDRAATFKKRDRPT